MNKENPIQCKSKVCCKATAAVEESVLLDLLQEDKCLGALLKSEGEIVVEDEAEGEEEADQSND